VSTPQSGDGELVLVGTPIGNIGDLSPRAASSLAEADLVCCEDTRHTGTMLKRLGIKTERLISLHAANEAQRIPLVLEELIAGRSVAVVSDAGMPGIADPGERLVRAAAEAGVRVTAVPGPSAVPTAVALSGLGGGRWRFEGWVARKGRDRATQLAAIASSSCPSVCFESPQRIVATLGALSRVCGPERKVAVCRELTKLHEEVLRMTVAAAAAHFATVAPRGEFVIVVEAAPAGEGPAAPDAASLRLEVQALVGSGRSRRDAVDEVADRHALARRTVYDAALSSL
jgi:16S rRNA (cytidine1402-2'-O)-methyltransferase